MSIKVKCSQLHIVHLPTYGYGTKRFLVEKLNAKPLFKAVLELLRFFMIFSVDISFPFSSLLSNRDFSESWVHIVFKVKTLSYQYYCQFLLSS